MLIYGIGCLYKGWHVRLEDGAFEYGMECKYTGRGVSIRGWGVIKLDGVLVNRMGCYFPGWSVSKRDGVLLSGMRC